MAVLPVCHASVCHASAFDQSGCEEPPAEAIIARTVLEGVGGYRAGSVHAVRRGSEHGLSGHGMPNELGIPASACGPPTRHGGVIRRPNLVKRFLDGVDSPLVMVAAPAGYGKSTAVTLWSDDDERRFAWVRLEALDDDPVHLLRHIAASLDHVVGVEAELIRVLTGPGRSFDTAQLPALGQHLSMCGDLVLVIDDVHLLSTDTSRAVFMGLLSYLGEGAQMVFVGRHEPDIPLARKRLEGELLEIGIDELVMDEAEAAGLLASAGIDLDDEEVADLVGLTEGWPGGIGLAALAYGNSGGYRRSALGRDRYVIGYMIDEVLAGLDPAVSDFMLRSSVLERMSPSLLDTLLGIEHSSRLLDEIERSGNLFLIRIDNDGEWYRYHHLFRDALRTQLAAAHPEMLHGLGRQAGRLLEARGDIDGAVRHAVEVGELQRAADLILQHTMRLIDEGRIGVLGQWLQLLGPELAERYPSAVIATAWYALGTTDANLIGRTFAVAEKLPCDGPLADGSPSLEVALAAVRAMVAGEGTPGVMRDTEIVRAGGGPRENPWWGYATALQGAEASLTGDYERARELLLAGIAELGGSPSLVAGYLGVLSLIEVDENDLVSAGRHARRAIALCEAHNLEGVVLDVHAYAAAALVAGKEGRQEEANSASMRARRLLIRLGDLSPRSSLRGYVALAQAALAVGSIADAREMAAEAERARRLEPQCSRLNELLDDVCSALENVTGTLGLEVTPISEAELRVLVYLPTHLTLREIAEATHLSRNTVKSHAMAIYRKLEASSRAEAVAAARSAGLIETLGPPASP